MTASPERGLARRRRLGAGDTRLARAAPGLRDGTSDVVVVLEDPDAPLRRPVVHPIDAGIAPDRATRRGGAFPRRGRNPGTISATARENPPR